MMKFKPYNLTKIAFTAFILISFYSCNKPDCADNNQNGDELGIDCGGDCIPCVTCFDGIKNQDEVNIDCGGSCAPCSILYPETGAYGLNLLNKVNDTIWTSSQDFSFTSIVPKGSSLKLELELISGTVWFIGQNFGYAVSNYSQTEKNQLLTVINTELTNDLNLHLPSASTFIVKFFENSNAETKRLVVIRN